MTESRNTAGQHLARDRKGGLSGMPLALKFCFPSTPPKKQEITASSVLHSNPNPSPTHPKGNPNCKEKKKNAHFFSETVHPSLGVP